MMKRIALLLILLLMSGISSAQTSMEERRKIMDPRNYPNGFAFILGNELLTRASDISKYRILDTAQYVATYHYQSPDSTKGRVPSRTMILEIGRRKTVFYDKALREADSLHTITSATISGQYVSYHIYTDIASQQCEVIQRIPFSSGKAIAVKEERPIQWTLDSLQCNMLGYRCFRATTTFRGRSWIAWYAPEIPIPTGPWKLIGLPGLLLKAEDFDGIFSFKCLSIVKHPALIKKFDWKYTPMTQKAWLKFEKRIHDVPFAMFGQNTLIVGSGRGRLDETWTVPYFPIELE